jgi:hypothetical protein
MIMVITSMIVLTTVTIISTRREELLSIQISPFYLFSSYRLLRATILSTNG